MLVTQHKDKLLSSMSQRPWDFCAEGQEYPNSFYGPGPLGLTFSETSNYSCHCLFCFSILCLYSSLPEATWLLWALHFIKNFHKTLSFTLPSLFLLLNYSPNWGNNTQYALPPLNHIWRKRKLQEENSWLGTWVIMRILVFFFGFQKCKHIL